MCFSRIIVEMRLIVKIISIKTICLSIVFDFSRKRMIQLNYDGKMNEQVWQIVYRQTNQHNFKMKKQNGKFWMKSFMNKLKRKISLNECGIEDLIGHTFIIRSSVLNTISIIIKYSNGVETTMRQILYLKLFRLLGIYRSSGRAPIVKSIHDFCSKETKNLNLEHSDSICCARFVWILLDFCRFLRLAIRLHLALEMW